MIVFTCDVYKGLKCPHYTRTPHAHSMAVFVGTYALAMFRRRARRATSTPSRDACDGARIALERSDGVREGAGELVRRPSRVAGEERAKRDVETRERHEDAESALHRSGAGQGARAGV